MGICHTAPIKYQRGSAIVFAMGISLLVVALSAALLLWLTLDIRRVKHLQDASERVGALETAEAIAAEKLSTLPEDWETAWKMDIGGIKSTGKLIDLSGRLNINTLLMHDTEEKTQEFFMPKAVIERFLVSQSVENAENIIEEVISDNNILLGVNSLPGLSGVKDFFYGASPDNQKVNINSVSPEILSTILDISSGKAAALLAQKPYASLEEVEQMLKHHELVFDTPSPVETWLTTEGTYYLLETTIVQNRTMKIYSVFHRDEKTVTLKWRSWGALP